MSAGAYLLGCACVLVVVAAVGFGAWSLRSWLMPQWLGPPARLAEVVCALATLVLVAEVAGSFSQFNRPALLLGSVVAGTVFTLLGWRGRLRSAVVITGPRRLVGSNRSPLLEVSAATAGVAVVAAQWAGKVGYAVRNGMTSADTVWFHATYAALFKQRGDLLIDLDPRDPWHSYSGQTGELFHAIFDVLFGRDLVSPWLNAGWAGLALLAAWCIGRRVGTGPLCVLGVAVVLGLPMIAASHPGQATTDFPAAALLLASIALLVQGGIPLVPLTLAGLAAGMALGTSVTATAPAIVLTIGVIALSWRRERLRVGLAWTVGLVATGGYWYLRNAIVVGNPVPYYNVRLGPFTWSAVPQAHGPSVSRYLFNSDVGSNVFVPGLRVALGNAWPVVVVLAAVGVVCALFPGRPAAVRLSALAIGIGLVAYVFTPFTGELLVFAFRVLYIVPPLLGAIVFAGIAVADARRALRRGLVAVMLALVAINSFATNHDGVPAWPAAARVLGPLAVIAVVSSVVAWRAARARRLFPSSGQLEVVAAAGVALLVAIGWPVQHYSFDHRYTDAGLSLDAVNAALQGVHDAHVAYFGTGEIYPLFGAELANRLSQPLPGPTESPESACRIWRAIMSYFDYVVVASGVAGIDVPPPAAVRNVTNLVPIARDPKGTLYKVTGRLSDTGC